MKFLAMLLTLLASAPAFALPMGEVLPRSWINGQPSTFVGVLNRDSKNMKLDVYTDPCGQFSPAEPGTIRCLAAAKYEFSVEVPVMSVKDDCGSKVYYGMKDATPVDGAREILNVTDNSRRLCENVIPSLLVVEGSIYYPWPNKTVNFVFMK